jgi:signal peptidase complex subunit 2
MAPRKNAKGLSPAPSTPAHRPSLVASSPEKPPGPLSITISPEEREIIKVNNYSASELKNACDDALKRVRSFYITALNYTYHSPLQYLSRPVLFKQIHLHTDVRLALGWAGVFTAAATGLYGWKIDFEKSKPGVWIGFILQVFTIKHRDPFY